MCVLKFLRDEIAAKSLQSRLPDPVVERGFIFCTKYEKYEIYRPPLSQSNRIFRANDN